MSEANELDITFSICLSIDGCFICSEKGVGGWKDGGVRMMFSRLTRFVSAC